MNAVAAAVGTAIDERASVVLDLRCLQDPDYALRGVGRHALALLTHAPPELRLVGLIDTALPDLLPEARASVQELCTTAYAAALSAAETGRPAAFVSLSPMTHDPLFVARLLTDNRLVRVAVVHDFIPYRWPERYLAHVARRLGYHVSLRWLARCDLFLPNSQTSADEVSAILGVPRHAVQVTGCPFDPAFEMAPASVRGVVPRHILMVGGSDARKNPDVVIKAHAASTLMQGGDGIPLVIAGRYGHAEAEAFRSLAVSAGGRSDLLEVPGQLPEEALLELFGQALALISSSRDEGFSIPVIEGMAAQLPCLVSDIPAHAELVTDPACRFAPDDHVGLSLKLDRLVTDAGWRAAMLARQAEVWPRFRAAATAERFWTAIRQRLVVGAPAIVTGRRPRVAILSPMPPDRSGVADYTAATCEELGSLVDLHVFTEAQAPTPQKNVASIRHLSALPHLAASFDRVISVVGNSEYHLRIFELLHRYGGACIAHDARMSGFYRSLLGRERTLAVAARELGRAVTDTDIDRWLADESKLEALFLGEIAESGSPTFVHSRMTAALFRDRYGIDPVYLPFSVYHPWRPDELTPDRRAEARRRLQIESDSEIVIATFGFAHNTKAPEECIWALEVLRSWGVPASLHFVGPFEPTWTPTLRPLVAELGLERHVRLMDGYVPEQVYRDYLCGANLGIQLRTYGWGQLSGALIDCVAAGLPIITNESLATALGVPDYVRSIPDAISPLLLAEALADIVDSGVASVRPEAARRAFCHERSFANYSRELCRHLGLEIEYRPAQAEEAA